MGDKCGMKGPDIKNRERGVVEIKQIFADALEKYLNISSAWLMNDQGEMMVGQGKMFNNPGDIENTSLIIDTLSSYVPSNKSAIPASTPDPQDDLRYAIKAYDILASGTGYANALRENITWFLRAVENEKRIMRVEDEMKSLKKQLSESGILPSS